MSQTAAPQAAYRSEAELIAELIARLKRGELEEAVQLYASCQADLGYPLVHEVQGDPVLLKLTATLLYKARDFAKAAECCEHLGELGKAAQLYEKCGDFETAAHIHARAGDQLSAARLFERSGDQRQAAAIYEREGALLPAAECHLRLGEHLEAGRLFHQVAQPQRAVDALQQVSVTGAQGVEARLLLAEVFASGGFADLAMTTLRSALAERAASGGLGTEEVPLMERLAELQAAAGQLEQAQLTARHLLGVDRHSATAAQILAGEAGSAPPPAGQPLPDIIGDTEAAPSPMVATSDGIEVLRSLPLFSELSLPELKEIHHLCSVRAFTAGEVLIPFGARSDALWVFLAGTAQVRIPSRDDPVAVLGQTDHVGEMSLIEDRPASADVVASSDGRALRLDLDGLRAALQRDTALAASVYRVLAQQLSKRLRETSAQL